MTQKHNIQICVCGEELQAGRLSDWEANFIESLTDQIMTRQFISEKQEEILQKIYDKVV